MAEPIDTDHMISRCQDWGNDDAEQAAREMCAELDRLYPIEKAAREVVAVMDDTTGELGPDLSMCDYFRGIGSCSFGCQTEPACQTDRWEPWPMEALRSALEADRG